MIIVHLNPQAEVRQALAKIEVDPEQIINPYCTRRVGKKHIWEWRCKVELHGKQTEMIGHSNSAVVTPTKWWPVLDDQPVMRVRTMTELREETIMAVRGHFREMGENPDEQSALSALIALLEMVKHDPDFIASEYWNEAAASTEIARFISAWEMQDIALDLLRHRSGAGA